MKTKIVRRSLLAVWVLLAIAYAPSAAAQAVDKEKAETSRIGEKVSIEVYGGYLKGQSRELVYDAATGAKQSELFWNIDEAYVIGGTLAVRPLEWLTLRVGGWAPVKSGNTMDDYDWLTAGETDWTHHSNHSDTQLNRGHMIDAGVTARLVKFKKTSWFRSAQVDLLAGYRWFYMNWSANGGDFIYSADGGFRNQHEVFTEGIGVISYEQWIETPYVGLGGSIDIARWTFAASITGSLWGRASDRDYHYLRNLIFEESFTNMPMLAGEFKAGYALTNRLSLFGSISYLRYFEVQGPSTMTNYNTGQVDYSSGNAAGMSHYSSIVSLGLKYAF